MVLLRGLEVIAQVPLLQPTSLQYIKPTVPPITNPATESLFLISHFFIRIFSVKFGIWSQTLCYICYLQSGIFIDEHGFKQLV